MPRFSANLTMMFQEHAFRDRFRAASAAGFRAVEYVSPYEEKPEVISGLLVENGLTQALFNMPAGNWAAGERGIACLPDRTAEFRESVDVAITYARALQCKTVNCLAGVKPPALTREAALETMAENLAYAAPRLAEAGVLLVVEPINFIDIPGFLLNRSADGLAVIDAAGVSNLKLQFDIYHMQRMEGELAATLERLMPRIGHIQIADNPGRHEPGTGEINYSFLFDFIDRLAYAGWVGAEYRPAGRTEDGLDWMARWR